ncbi:MAG TPA: tetratricopeptide repeat protein [Myxococcota bacterium]|nr:tetratricopeptide repeat protein [Myxococcota bacterium]HRY92896.1 tetratricopeptide repeat protein [Myxococcota bacterium]HSA23752.1 tetratricopeptide repeat protein [Myxococcota bacterium]
MKRASLTLALLALATALACQDGDLSARFEEGLDLLYENRFEDAEAHFLSLARDMDRSQRADAAVWRSKALYQTGRIDHLYLNQPRRAVARLREAIKAHPDAPHAFEARQEIGDIFHDRLHDYRSAALEYERLVSEFPDHPATPGFHYRIAQCYFLLGEHDQARSEARLLLSKHADSKYQAEARLLIANSYYVEGKVAESAQAHQELLAVAPEASLRARSQFELGLCYQDLGDLPAAERAFLAALKDHTRPDIVQHQLTVLRQRMREGSDAATPLPNPLAGSVLLAPASVQPQPGEPVRTALPPRKPGDEPELKPPANYKPQKPKAEPDAPKGPDTQAEPKPEPKPEPAPAPPPDPAQPEPAPAPAPAPEPAPAAP